MDPETQVNTPSTTPAAPAAPPSGGQPGTSDAPPASAGAAAPAPNYRHSIGGTEYDFSDPEQVKRHAEHFDRLRSQNGQYGQKLKDLERQLAERQAAPAVDPAALISQTIEALIAKSREAEEEAAMEPDARKQAALYKKADAFEKKIEELTGQNSQLQEQLKNAPLEFSTELEKRALRKELQAYAKENPDFAVVMETHPPLYQALVHLISSSWDPDTGERLNVEQALDLLEKPVAKRVLSKEQKRLAALREEADKNKNATVPGGGNRGADHVEKPQYKDPADWLKQKKALGL